MKKSTQIYLTGFMGAGKSTIGKILSEKIDYKFIDLDSEIVKQEGKPISQIFAEDGEESFREREMAILSRTVEPSTVVATGGGIVLRETNRAYMKANGIVVYLKASWPVTKSRLMNSTERPLVDLSKGWESVEARWIERQQYYEEADYVIDTDEMTPEQCAQEIINTIGM